MYARAASAYRAVDLASAPKGDILTRLYDRLLADVAAARAAIERRDIAGKAAALDHATLILTELRAALDHARAPELCGNLEALYVFVLDRLTQANLHLTIAPLGEAAAVLTQLRDAFAEAKAAG